MSRPTTTRRSRRALLTDARGVAEMLSCPVEVVRIDHEEGRLPGSVLVGGEHRWRVAEIRAWVRVGCPDRRTWEGERRR